MKSSKQTILVTGAAGYIGSVITRRLLEAGFAVRALDILRSGGESLLELWGHSDFSFIKGDVRDAATVAQAAAGCYGVAHLAAIVGDPACRKEPDLARSTNLDGSKLLYEAANRAGCERFVFASTCSNYGKMADPESFVTEESDLSPLSIYAETKVAFEKYLLGQPRTNPCIPTCLRFSTVYGLSPRMRFDLTVNEFTREVALGKKLVIFGEQFWRPYCHVADLARSVIAVIQAETASVGFDVFNVGDTTENYTKQMIVDEILRQIPSAVVEKVSRKEDPRDYRVNFDKIRSRIGFKITKRLPDGIREIREILEHGMLLNPYDPRYSNV